jgi:hypothetical protein
MKFCRAARLKKVTRFPTTQTDRLKSLSSKFLEEFKTWLDEQSKVVIPQTEIARAVGYSRNQWEAFIRYCLFS